MFEIRHYGKLVHREAEQAKAQAWAEANLPDLEEVSVAPGRAFEVYADGGIGETFDSLEEAWAYLKAMREQEVPTPRKERRVGGPATQKRFKQVEARMSDGVVLELSSEPSSETPTDPAPAMEQAEQASS